MCSCSSNSLYRVTDYKDLLCVCEQVLKHLLLNGVNLSDYLLQLLTCSYLGIFFFCQGQFCFNDGIFLTLSNTLSVHIVIFASFSILLNMYIMYIECIVYIILYIFMYV